MIRAHFLLAAVGIGSVATACFGEAPAWNCADNAELRRGPLLLFNNVWNKGSLDDYEQCIALGEDAFHWRWRWPGGDLMPEAYPEIVFGHHPWRTDSTTEALPRKLGDAGPLEVEYAVRLAGGGRHNLAFQLWLVDALPPTPAGARAEVMVWVANHGMTPAGEKTSVLAHADARYDLYEAQREHLDRGVPRSWKLVTLVSQRPQLEARLELGALLQQLVERGHLDEALWVANVDLGTEVVSGSGSADVTAYRVTVASP
ncbi:MAG: hypothetical protein MJE66_04895 [Proteobacteria bacterium]|nr:hypothetical protein [Pseudomonadota bacterium]